MQSSLVENIGLVRAAKLLGDLGAPAVVFLSLASDQLNGGYLFAVRFEACTYQSIGPPVKLDFMRVRRVNHIWIRWDDGIDRSPFPRKVVKRRAQKKRQTAERAETECYKLYHQIPAATTSGTV